MLPRVHNTITQNPGPRDPSDDSALRLIIGNLLTVAYCTCESMRISIGGPGQGNYGSLPTCAPLICEMGNMGGYGSHEHYDRSEGSGNKCLVVVFKLLQSRGVC